MIKLSKNKRAQEKARKNIGKFLSELDAQTPDDFDDIFGERHYYSNLFQRTWIVRMLNEYNERKEQAKKQLDCLLKEIKLEKNNGFKYLNTQERYALNEKRRFEAEKIVRNASLERNDAGELLVPVVCNIYQRGKFYDENRYRLNEFGEVVRRH